MFDRFDNRPFIGAKLIQEEAVAAQTEKKEDVAVENVQAVTEVHETPAVVQPTEKLGPKA